MTAMSGRDTTGLPLSFLPDPVAADCSPDQDLADSFAALMGELHLARGGSPAELGPLRRAARALSLATSAGHTCLDAAEAGGEAQDANAWRASPVVGQPGQGRPVILDGQGRLYLHRYWDYEQRLAARLAALAAGAPTATPRAIDAALDCRLPGAGPGSERQRAAARHVVTRGLTILSGGPGTGKTTTLAAAISAYIALQPDAVVLLAAPTGKAAARLQEALARSFDAALPAASIGAATLHRLLGWNPTTRRFRHGADNPLACDLLVIDEASMLDLALATRCAEALPPGARLVLVGDRDQLASVEAGAVFAELAHATQAGLSDSLVTLDHSHRFDAGGAIGALARAVRDGAAAQAVSLLAQPAGSQLVWHRCPATTSCEQLAESAFASFLAYLERVRCNASPSEILAALASHRVLCAVRDGPRGTRRCNEALSRLFRDHLGEPAYDGWYHGRPVLITANDHVMRVYNGDLGVALPDEHGRLAVFIADADGGVRSFAPQRLPACETAFATTVHKAQGGEFDSVDLLLPERPNRVLTRELLYTALTRCRQRASLWGDEAIFAEGVANATRRRSGLGARIAEACGVTPPQLPDR